VYPIVVIDHRSRLSYAAGAMKTLWVALDAFLQEHRRRGQTDGGVEGERVWMTCDGGGAALSRQLGHRQEDT
jgi:hypothetical protein